MKTEQRVMSGNGSNGNGTAAREHVSNGKKPPPVVMAQMLERVNLDGDMYFVGSMGPVKLLMRAKGKSEGDQPIRQLF